MNSEKLKNAAFEVLIAAFKNPHDYPAHIVQAAVAVLATV